MVTVLTNCTLCDLPKEDGVKKECRGEDGLEVDCPDCGHYELRGEETIIQIYSWGPERKSALSRAVRQAFDARGERVRITSVNAAAELAKPHMTAIKKG